AQANMLNLLESKGDTGTLLLGAWCPDPSSDTTLAFCTFVPNLLAKWILVGNLLSYMASHSRFAAQALSAMPSTMPSTTPSTADALEQLGELAKAAARTSSLVAAAAAKKGLARLRERLAEDRREK
ncbi:MAG: hypothetical protein WD118_07070, partial [Phycisphaeraceae bacterium]